MQTQTWLGCLLLKLHLFFSGSVLCIYRNPRVIPRNDFSMERALGKEKGGRKNLRFWMKRKCLHFIQHILKLETGTEQQNYTWFPVLFRKHENPINITRLIYSEPQRNKLFLKQISNFKRPGSTSCQVWNSGTNAESYIAVYAISLSCNIPIKSTFRSFNLR